MLLATSRFLAAAICTLLVTTLCFAATPLTFTYQGYLKNAAGVPVNDKVTITFSLYANEADQTAVWKEIREVTPLNGIYSIVLGTDTVKAPLDPSIFTGTPYLGISIGEEPEMTPRQALTSAPFAMRAAVADSLTDGAIITSDKIDFAPILRSTETSFYAGNSAGFNSSGGMNTAVGTNSLVANISGGSNSAVGHRALEATTASENTAVGMLALNNNTTGSSNTAVGMYAGSYQGSGDFNTFIGYNANFDGQTPISNATAIGSGALVTQSNSMVLGNTAVKVGIGTSTPTEKLEVVGNIKLPSSTATTGRIMMGTETVLHSPNPSNIFTGSNAGNSINTGTGISNTATGHMALSTNADGHANTAVGASALKNAYADSEIPDSGGNNTAVGAYALQGITTGTGNTAVGSFAGAPFGGTTAPARTGVNNTFIGTESGQGVDALLFNATAIGYQALVSQNNSLVLGRPGVQVGIGTATPKAELDVVGNVKVSGTLTPGSLNLPMNSLTVGTNQLTVAGNKVGVGTNVPEATLDVVGNAAITGPLVAGSLTLPADSLTVGTDQLKLSGGMVGIGATPTTAKLQVTNTGPSGQTALFQNNHPSNGLPTMYVTTVSSGAAVFGLAQGSGTAGHFQILNTGSGASVLVAETNGTGYAAEILGKMRVTGPITSTVTGTAPFTVASNTEVPNLNANLLNGKLASEIISAASDEVRTPVNTCHDLTSQGSYYLTNNLISNSSRCMSISNDNITVDLMGFYIAGSNTGSNPGIEIIGNNIEIKNGTIRGFYNGISAVLAANSSRIINMRAIGNTNNGFNLLNAGGLIKDSLASGNGNDGFHVSSNYILTNNLALNNSGNGILAKTGSLVTGNIVSVNQGAGIRIEGAATVSHNTVSGNSGSGIYVFTVGVTGSKITDNLITANNSADSISGAGLITGASCLVKNNHIYNNNQNNIYASGSRSIFEENLITDSINGIFFGVAGNFYMNNRAAGNTTDFNLNGTTQANGGGNISF